MLADNVTSILNSQITQTPARETSTELGKEDFLLLLVKQLANQDPLDPMDNAQFMSQLAEFSALEQSINLNESFSQFLQFQELTQASTLIGKQIIAIQGTNDGYFSVTGVVDQVIALEGKVVLHLKDGTEVFLESVVSVEGSTDSDATDSDGSDS